MTTSGVPTAVTAKFCATAAAVAMYPWMVMDVVCAASYSTGPFSPATMSGILPDASLLCRVVCSLNQVYVVQSGGRQGAIKECLCGTQVVKSVANRVRCRVIVKARVEPVR